MRGQQRWVRLENSTHLVGLEPTTSFRLHTECSIQLIVTYIEPSQWPAQTWRNYTRLSNCWIDSNTYVFLHLQRKLLMTCSSEYHLNYMSENWENHNSMIKSYRLLHVDDIHSMVPPTGYPFPIYTSWLQLKWMPGLLPHLFELYLYAHGACYHVSCNNQQKWVNREIAKTVKLLRIPTHTIART